MDQSLLARDAEDLLAHITEGRALPHGLTPMPGGASTRRYFRSTSGAVAMYVPDSRRSDELAHGEQAERWPFLVVQELLAGAGAPVPEIRLDWSDRGLIFLEDLGDETLAQALVAHPEERVLLYRIAVQELVSVQRALDPLPANSLVSSRQFDEELLRWEVDHFREYALEARGVELTPSERTVFDDAAHWLAKRVAALPRGFVHRDYQSRNLMVRRRGIAPELVWIDFQDALTGPRLYDMVALLGDSYQRFTEEFLVARLREYHELRQDGQSFEELWEQFHLITLQRKLKDAGRFVFILHRKRDRSFLRFVDPTLDLVRRSLRELQHEPALANLPAVLASTLARATSVEDLATPA